MPRVLVLLHAGTGRPAANRMDKKRNRDDRRDGRPFGKSENHAARAAVRGDGAWPVTGSYAVATSSSDRPGRLLSVLKRLTKSRSPAA